MREERKINSFKNDRLSVSDQPGWTLILVGLFISFTIGFSIRSLLAPSRIRPYIEQAAKQINRNVTVRLGSIEASLSKYGVPRLALILQNIRIHNHNECFKDSLLDITQMEIPLNLLSVLKGKPEINSVVIDEMELRIPELSQKCLPNAHASTLSSPAELIINSAADSVKTESTLSIDRDSGKTQATNTQTHIRIEKKGVLEKYQDSLLELITVKRLRIIAVEYPFIPMEFRNIKLEILSHKPQWIRLHANLSLFKDDRFSNYLTNSKVVMEYNQSHPTTFSGTMTGNLREGSYKFLAQYNPKDHFVNFAGDVRHFPLVEIYKAFPQYSQWMKISENSPMWLSSRFNISGDKVNITDNAMQIQQLKIEGDPIDFEADKIEVTKLSPLEFQKFNVRLNKLNLDVVNRILTRPINNPSLYNLGQLEGILVVRSKDNMDFTGDWKNLGFIFSNKGERRIQMLNRVSLSGILREDKTLKVKLNKFEPAGGVLNGEAYLQHNLSEHKTHLTVEVDELKLDEDVVRLFTRGGYLQNLRANLNMEWIKNTQSLLTGVIYSSEAMIENIKLSKLKFQMSNPDSRSGATVQALLSFDKLELLKEHYSILNQIFKDEENDWIRFSSANSRTPTVIFNYRPQQSFNWSIRALVNKDKQMNFASTGSWDSQGLLSGVMDLRIKNKRSSYKLTGTRDVPRIENLK